MDVSWRDVLTPAVALVGAWLAADRRVTKLEATVEATQARVADAAGRIGSLEATRTDQTAELARLRERVDQGFANIQGTQAEILRRLDMRHERRSDA